MHLVSASAYVVLIKRQRVPSFFDSEINLNLTVQLATVPVHYNRDANYSPHQSGTTVARQLFRDIAHHIPQPTFATSIHGNFYLVIEVDSGKKNKNEAFSLVGFVEGNGDLVSLRTKLVHFRATGKVKVGTYT